MTSRTTPAPSIIVSACDTRDSAWVAWLLLSAALLVGFANDLYRTTAIARATIVVVGEWESYAQPDWSRLPNASKAAAALGWGLALSAAALALFGDSRRCLPTRYTLFYVGLWGCAGYLLLGLSTDPLAYVTTSYRFFSKLAPGTLFAIGVFFLGANPCIWPRIRQTLLILLAAACAAWLLLVTQMARPSRLEAYRWIYEQTGIIEVLAVLPLAMAAHGSRLRRLTRYLPLALLTGSIILMQTRLLIVMWIVLVCTYIYLRRRAGEVSLIHSARATYVRAFAAGITVVAGLLIAWPFIGESLLPQSAEALWERRFQDTRTGQIAPFFEKATWDKLLIGAGYPAKGEYTAEGSTGLDIGYLSTMYVVGAPMVILFVAMLVVPVIRCLSLRLSAEDAAVVTCAFAYCVRLTSSTVPLYSVQFLIVCLLMGRCAYILREASEAHLDGARA